MQIFKFNSILKTLLWGGDKLVEFKQLPQTDSPIGESWELSAIPGNESVVANGDDCGLTLTELIRRYGAALVGEDVYRRYGDRFPLLFKFIDAKRDLSIQVHPDDEMAMRCHGCTGKNEMWYIVQADEGAVIRAGFNRPVTPEEYERYIEDGTILDVVNAIPAHAGDAFFIPAGQIHSIGTGNLLVEIQQSCDITYRVYDYNRRDADGNLRELHTRQARQALNFTTVDSKIHDTEDIMPGVKRLYRNPIFDVWHVEFKRHLTLPLEQPHSFAAVICLEGKMTLSVAGEQPVALKRGETALIPAVADELSMTGHGELLVTTVPNSMTTNQ